MTDLQMLGNSFFKNLAWYRRTKDLVPLFYLKLHIFENSILKIKAELNCLSQNACKNVQLPLTDPNPSFPGFQLVFVICVKTWILVLTRRHFSGFVYA